MYNKPFSQEEYEVLTEFSKTYSFVDFVINAKEALHKFNGTVPDTIAMSEEIYNIYCEQKGAHYKDSLNICHIDELKVVFIPHHCICMYDSKRSPYSHKSEYELACLSAASASNLMLFQLGGYKGAFETVDYTGNSK